MLRSEVDKHICDKKTNTLAIVNDTVTIIILLLL